MTIKFNLFHANVKSNPLMAQPKVDFDLVRIKRLGRNGGFNEIKPTRYKDAVQRVFGKSNVHNLDTESPQVFNPKIFRVIRSYSVKTHGGFAAMTPTRLVCVTITTTVKDHIPVAFIESHYINKGMHIPVALRKTDFRKKLHARHFAKEQAIIEELVLAGFTVFGGEDVNQKIMSKYHKNQVWIHNQGIDKMWYVPADNVTVTLLDSEVVTDTHTFLNTDHPALKARVAIRINTRPVL